MPVEWVPAPRSYDEAVKRIVADLSPEELTVIRQNTPAKVHNTLGRAMRSHWSLDRENALSNNIRSKYGLSHGDDLSSMILHGAWALIFGYQFDAEAHAAGLRDHWEGLGQDPAALRPVGAPGRKKKEFYADLEGSEDDEDDEEEETEDEEESD